MSETVVEAFERLAREHLDNPDISVVHSAEPRLAVGSAEPVGMDERTEISVTHHGDPEALEDLEAAHAEAIMSRWSTTSRDLAPAGSEERVLVTDAEFVLGCDPHEEYVSGGAGASVSGSGSSTSASPETETDGHEDASTDESDDETPERVWGGDLADVLQPSLECTEEPDGTRHVLAAQDAVGGGEDFHVCEEVPISGATHIGSVKDQYDSLKLFAADPDLCEVCARVIILFYNLPEDEVLDVMEAEYDG